MKNSDKLTGNKTTIYITAGIMALLMLVGVGAYIYTTSRPSSPVESPKELRSQSDDNKNARKAGGGDLSEYEHALIGDNSAVIRIVRSLSGGSNIDEIEIKIEESPYGIRLRGNDELTVKQANTISTQLLKLVDDCEWVEINSSQFYSKVTKNGETDFRVIN